MNSLKKPTLHVELMDVGSRAALMLCDITGIEKSVVSWNTESEAPSATKALEKLNPKKTLPFMEAETNFAGGHLIMRYLCDTRLPADNTFYPRDDIKKRAKVDMMLDWHLTTLSACGRLVDYNLLGEEEYLRRYKDLFNMPSTFEFEAEKNLRILDQDLFQRGLWGQKELTLADLLIFNEVLKLNLINYDLSPYPQILKFINTILADFPDSKNLFRKHVLQLKSKGIPTIIQIPGL